MAKDGIEYLMEQLKLSDKAITQMEGQRKILEGVMDGVINNVSPEEKAKMLEFRAQAERVLNKAQRGEAYDGTLDKMRDSFQQQEKDGSTNN